MATGKDRCNMNITKIVNTTAKLNAQSPDNIFDHRVLIACINAEARTQSATIIAEAIDRQGAAVLIKLAKYT